MLLSELTSRTDTSKKSVTNEAISEHWAVETSSPIDCTSWTKNEEEYPTDFNRPRLLSGLLELSPKQANSHFYYIKRGKKEIVQ
ncbi:hypothetical protein A6R68_16815 [Neotoma lepida]|uniref:Uncharacterized protein n=1 Tax=Neotoma lepida TaxID=56216 RepID=A0A1A6HEP0_NEOLE|nr:hypothetical protein A6R68_16815 [Neotoma lepida]